MTDRPDDAHPAGDGDRPRRRPRAERLPAGTIAQALRRSVKSDVRMVPGVLTVDGRRIQYAVSDNTGAHGPDGPGTPPIWAVNIHGYFAGGGMYWRESVRLAEALGWRVVTPNLPGFGGSAPLRWDHVSMRALSEQLTTVADHLGAGPAVLLGHSMGGAVAVQWATDHPDRTLGLIYRDGVATPAWKRRTGLITAVVGPVAPDIAAMVDLVASVAIDVPDFFAGRMYSTIRSILPDSRANIRAASQTMPVGTMLMAADLRDEVQALAERGEIPILPIWGVFDRIAHRATAVEFEQVSGAKVQWVPGGHSWMFARPQGQVEVLRYLDRGLAYLESVEERWRLLTGQPTVGQVAPDGRRGMRIVS
jgi:pimeloyl-ACP methyl ester carboxylesterase